MIKKLEHQTKMEFGTGDIGFNAGVIKADDDKVGIVIFYNQDPRKIGTTGDIKAGTEVDINDFPVVMKFYRKESIDVIIKALLEAKKEMEQCSCYKFGESTNSGMKCSNCGREL